MQSVDLVVTNIDWLITVDTGRRVIRDAAIAVKGGKIVAIGKSANIAKDYSAAKTVDAMGAVATPGFIDCHLHSSFQLSRGLADEANAQAFLFERMYPYEAALEHEDVRLSATLAAAELLKHGVTCFIDPGNYHPEASVEGIMSTIKFSANQPPPNPLTKIRMFLDFFSLRYPINFICTFLRIHLLALPQLWKRLKY